MCLKFILLIFCIQISCIRANQNVHVAQCGGRPLKQNARSSCPDANNCYTKCNKDYQFQTGLNEVDLFCNAGEWILKGLGKFTNINCEPICTPSCKNGGECIAPNICKCMGNFGGPLCDEDVCNTVPSILNSDPNCSQTSCIIKCDRGYKFPDGSESIDMKCKSGQFVSIHKNQTIPSACEPVCLSPCKNNGQCTAPNECTCTSGYEGNHCELEKDCQKPISQNTTLKCDTKQCKITCASGYEFPDKSTVMKMTCQQQNWKPVLSNQTFSPNCQPVCKPSCQNNGQCILPNTCFCLGRHEGNQCEYDTGCKTKPISHNSSPSNCSLDTCTITCDTGYALPDGSTKMDLICLMNAWTSVKGIAPTCTPVCSSPCKNNGECTGPNKCTCTSGYEGNHCELEKEFQKPISQNTTLKCDTKQCEITCANGYEFPDESTVMKMTYDLHEWKPVLSNQTFSPNCQPVCKPSCQNNGQCILPNTCFCLGRYEGKQCEFDKGCKTKPVLHNASPSNCSLDTCTIACDTGYALPDGSTKMNLTCTQRLWHPTEPTKENSTDCLPVCNLPCKNDGQCSEPNTCTCLDDFIGRQCEYQLCTTEPSAKNSVRNCTEDQCNITCNDGYQFADGTEVMQMTCPLGVWFPQFSSQFSNKDCQLKHKGTCIRLDTCPCTFDGVFYAAGTETIFADEWSSSARVCRCNDGQMSCIYQSFTRDRCTAFGDPHFTTFHGVRFDFMGRGLYRLLETDKIEVDSYLAGCPNPWDRVTCTDSIAIIANFNNKTAIIELMQDLRVEVNGATNYYYPLSLLDGYVLITQPSSDKVLVSFKDGFRIFWDGRNRVDVDKISLYDGRMDGLCTLSRSRRRRSIEEDDMKNWLTSVVKQACKGDSCKDVERDVNVPHPCDGQVEIKKKAQQLCERLKNDTFKSCHGTVKPDAYYESCVYDVCAYNLDTDTSMCDVFTAYANECSRRGVVITHWRKSIQECAIKCPNGQIYEECSTTCYRSCDDMQAVIGGFTINCSRDCIDGCRCPEGQALDEKSNCIPFESCPQEFKIHTFNCEPRPDNVGTNCTCIGTQWKCDKIIVKNNRLSNDNNHTVQPTKISIENSSGSCNIEVSFRFYSLIVLFSLILSQMF